MTLVDTSVLIDKLRKIENEKTLKLDELHRSGAPFGISIYTFHEVLQGAKSEVEFRKLYDYFSTQKIFSLPNTPDVFAKSARIYFDLRKEGTTVRNTIDILIAYTAIYYSLPLLHNDADFDYITEKIPKLQVI
ncbi:MAG: PIN domain-containing protein [Defluviitaleaceae bacterium]|nr:PIN domain-containing protein [Defluviitaleaceae bacterium]